MALGMTVQRMLSEMPGSELTEWMAYEAIEPWGPERADLRAAIVASATFNSQGAKTKPVDFMPDSRTAEERQE